MENCTNKEKIQGLLKAARKERKRDWGVYNTYRRKLEELCFDEDYNYAIHELCKILKL